MVRKRQGLRSVKRDEPHAEVVGARRDGVGSTSTREGILAVVAELLEYDGYEAVQLREVARRARVSLATIYKLFPTRDELIVTTLERWMATHCYADVTPPEPGETLHDGLMRLFRYVFEPWERSPRMLEAYHRASTGPGRERLYRQGVTAIGPAGRALLADADPAYAADIDLILTSTVHAVIGSFVEGGLDVTDILPTLERAVYRLTTNNEPNATNAVAGRPRHGNADSPH